MCCCGIKKQKQPVPYLTAVSGAAGVTRIDNETTYNDAGCNPATRMVEWRITLNGTAVWSSGLIALTDSLPIGTGSTGDSIILPLAADEVGAFFDAEGIRWAAGDTVRVIIRVKTCKVALSAWSNVITFDMPGCDNALVTHAGAFFVTHAGDCLVTH